MVDLFAVIGIELLMHKGASLRHECIDAPEQMVLWDAVVDDPQKQMIAGGQLIELLN